MTYCAMSGHSTTELRYGSTHVLTTVCKHKYYIKNSSDYISDYISDYNFLLHMLQLVYHK